MIKRPGGTRFSNCGSPFGAARFYDGKWDIVLRYPEMTGRMSLKSAGGGALCNNSLLTDDDGTPVMQHVRLYTTVV